MLKSNKGMKFLLAAAAVLGIILIAAQSAAYALGADLRVGSGGKNSFLTISNTDKVKNLYAVGGGVIVNASASKDAVVAGGSVSINGDVADDLIATGGTINLHGNVGGTARMAGGTINIDSKITDDLVIAGGNLIISKQASVGADLLAAGGVMVVEGAVHGNIKASGGSLYLNGQVDGNVNFRGQRLELGPDANIKGNIDYTSKLVYVRDPNAKVAGQVTYHAMTANGFNSMFTGASVIALLGLLIGEVLAALFLLYMYRKSFENVLNELSNSFWRSTMYGLVTMIVVPVAIIVLFLTLIGYYLAILLLAVFVLMLILSWIIATTQFGLWILGLLSRNKEGAGKIAQLTYVNVILALIIATIIRIIPVVGILFALVMILAGLGSLVSKFKRNREII